MDAASPLVMLGGNAVVCEGDACLVPEPTEIAIVNELLDSGTI